MITIKNYDSASELPAEWDSVIGDNLYLSREFVSFMESVDKCGQKYYMLYDDGVLDISPVLRGGIARGSLVRRVAPGCFDYTSFRST